MVFKETSEMNPSKPSNQSNGLGRIGCRDNISTCYIKRVPQWSHIGSKVKYRGEARTVVTLYTYIVINSHHVGKPKQKQTCYLYSIFGLRVPDYGAVISLNNMVLKMRFGVVISKEVFFYLVTTGWVLDISLLYENSIN